MPESVPTLSEEEITRIRAFSYPEDVYYVLRKFIDPLEVPDEDLRGVVQRSMSRFSEAEIIPVTSLNCGLKVFELFHGKTLAFKDLAMSVVTEFLSYFLRKRRRCVTALVGTSGDTGGSAIEIMRGIDIIDLIVLYPKDQITKIQELQMATVPDSNIHTFEVEGTPDDLDAPVKLCFSDQKFVDDNCLISVNSINWVRICAQVAHYFYVYSKMFPHSKNEIEIIVPTGAAGNITAGCIANRMGLPIKLIAAVNDNDIVARTLKDGDFSVRSEIFPSLASAMNIQIPYNLERILFLFSGNKALPVAQIMKAFETHGKVRIPNDLLDIMKEVIIETYIASNKEITDTTKKIYKQEKYILCPHSAVGASYHLNFSYKPLIRGLLATASPAKFPEATKLAKAPIVTKGIEHLKEEQKRSKPMRKGEDWLAIVKSCIQEITNRRKLQEQH